MHRYRSYLGLVLADYEQACTEWQPRHDAFWASLKGRSGTLDAAQTHEMDLIGALGRRVQLEIETSHLFVSILLDRAARAVHDTLTIVPGISLVSHSKLQRNLPAFAEAHAVPLPDGLADLAVSLEETEERYRDKHVAHMTQPRRMEGLSWDQDGAIRISGGVLHPRSENDGQDELGMSAIPSETIDRIDRYLGLVIDFMEANRRSTTTPEPEALPSSRPEDVLPLARGDHRSGIVLGDAIERRRPAVSWRPLRCGVRRRIL